MFIYFLLFLEPILATITILDKGVFPLEKNSVALQFYLDIENKDRVSACRVHACPKRCCLIDKEADCDAMHVYGQNEEIINPKDRKTLVFIYPTVFQHDKRGFCDLTLNYRCDHKLKRRQIFNITFDTRLAKFGKNFKNFKNYVERKKVDDCESMDEDSLKNCSPVDCNVKYADEKPYYDQNINKCVKAAVCVGDSTKELPDTVYLQDVNFCRDLMHPVEIQDVYAISHGLSIVTQKPKIEAGLIANLKSNCSTISQQLGFIRDIVSGRLCPTQKGVSVDYSRPCTMAALSILGYIFGIASMIVSFACCVHTLAWFHSKWDSGSLNNQWQKLRRKFQKRKVQKEPVLIQRTFSTRSSNVKNNLLREVIVRDIPLELRSSVIDVCDRVGKEVKWQKRYRVADMGRIGWDRDGSEYTSSTSKLQVNSDDGE